MSGTDGETLAHWRLTASISLAGCFLYYLVLLVTQTYVFGSFEGRWVFPYIARLTALPIFLFAASAPFVAVLLHLSFRHVERHPAPVLASWLVAGLGLQLLMRLPYPLSLAHIVRSDVCNSFYGVSLLYRPAQLLRAWAPTFVDYLPVHAHSNLPGKIFLYYFMELFSSRAATLGISVVVLSTFGGLLTFLIARRLFSNSTTALVAAVLYLLIPAKVGFLPILDTVSPLFIMTAFLIFLRWLDSPRPAWLVLLGASLYVALFVEPTPFVMGLLFLALLIQRIYLRSLSTRAIVEMAVITPAAFLTVHALMFLVFHFDIFAALRYAMNVTMTFYDVDHRPYVPWVVGNLREFLPNNGVFSTLLVGISLGTIGVGIGRALSAGEQRRQVLANLAGEPSTAFTLGVFGCLLFLDLFGGSRGETTRWWIFLAVFLQIAAADACIRLLDRRVAALAIFATLLQGFITTATVGWLVC